MGSVVDDLGRSYGRTGFQKIDAKPFPASGDMMGSDIVLAKGSYCAGSDLIVGNGGDKLCLMSIVCKGYGYVCLTIVMIFAMFKILSCNTESVAVYF